MSGVFVLRTQQTVTLHGPFFVGIISIPCAMWMDSPSANCR
jgi:hypothetical protein